jgi:hypothetical protein
VRAALAAVAAGTLVGGFTVTAATAAPDRSGTTTGTVTTLTTNLVAHWAPVIRRVDARRAPSEHAAVVTTVGTVTDDGTENILLLLSSKQIGATQTWFKVRLAILPNGSTGWVPRRALGTIYSVDTHLYVDRETETLTLKRSGVTIFTTRVGVGLPYWPTPSGQFYIRDKLTRYADPFYGPIAFGTSARSAVLTEWPGGGFIGVHGTDEPELIPGAVSHGCIRVVNAQILKLAKLLPVGTPLTVT